ncbi:hypothetical protein E4U39_000759 [Claviceps sp. Clav50 group G5]|nr:hypothetical protein E4U39_000759 [Claviceps sp. Clav50 group G5]
MTNELGRVNEVTVAGAEFEIMGSIECKVDAKRLDEELLKNKLPLGWGLYISRSHSLVLRDPPSNSIKKRFNVAQA